MPRLHFEDFRPGAADIPGSIAVTKDEIVAFAREFDAQPFHTDEDAAKRSFAGGLIASGWQSCGFLMRLIADGFINEFELDGRARDRGAEMAEAGAPRRHAAGAAHGARDEGSRAAGPRWASSASITSS